MDDLSDLLRLIDLVRAMREAQRAYAHERSHTNSYRARECERQVYEDHCR
jgi:hypothetical protein